MLVDAIGNPLYKGDLVMVTRGDQQLIGIVMRIDEPSLFAPGKDQMVMLGQIQVGLVPRLTDHIKRVKPPNFGKQES
jgi:hypothetical protein